MISPVNSQLERLHDMITVWLIVVMLMVIFIGGGILLRKRRTNLVLDSALLEVTWTIIPMVILITIAVPRLNILCVQDTILLSPRVRTKMVRNQWNWQREQIDRTDHLLDSEKLDELCRYEYPLLIPGNALLRILLTRRDVLHSLGIPSLGIKLDSAPGRLNSVIVESKSQGLFTGSCYELCGRGHRAIPIFILLV